MRPPTRGTPNQWPKVWGTCFSYNVAYPPPSPPGQRYSFGSSIATFIRVRVGAVPISQRSLRTKETFLTNFMDNDNWDMPQMFLAKNDLCCASWWAPQRLTTPTHTESTCPPGQSEPVFQINVGSVTTVKGAILHLARHVTGAWHSPPQYF